MTEINFPAYPTVGQLYIFGSRSYRYNGKGWQLLAPSETNSIDTSSFVRNTGNEVIAGVKTFSSPIQGTVADGVVTTGSYANPTWITSLAGSKVSGVVHDTGNETVAGTKTFSSAPVLPGVNGGQLAGLRNKIINGSFLVNQRAVSGTVTLAAGAYGHDRWKAGASGCTYTFATTNNVTTLTISAGSLQQVIEGNNLQSGTHVLSWTGTAQGRINAGSYAASGVTGTATGGTNLTVEFNTGTVSKVMFEEGSQATSFEQRPYSLELMLCQRYLPAFNGVGTTDDVGWGAFGSTNSGIVGFQYLVEPRVIPTGLTVSSVVHFSVTSMLSISTVTAITLGACSKRIARVSFTSSSAVYAAHQPVILLGVTAGAQLLFTGCEL